MPAPTPFVLEFRDQPEKVTPHDEFGLEESSVSVKSVYDLVARIVEPLVNWLKFPLPLLPLALPSRQ
jgi:hypothetical protein